MPENFYWKINHNYRDCGVRDSTLGYPDEDEFASKVSIDRAAHWGIANAGGIRTLRSSSLSTTQSDGSKNTIDDVNIPAAVFLISSKVNTSFDKPWEDKIDLPSGSIVYWGDAKPHQDNKIDDWPGNKVLAKINKLIKEDRLDLIPPILVFEREQQGQVTFKGLCILNSLEQTSHQIGGEQFKNYKCALTILNTLKVDPEWLKFRASGHEGSETKCPDAWLQYKNGSISKLTDYDPTVERIFSRLGETDINNSLTNPHKKTSLRKFNQKGVENFKTFIADLRNGVIRNPPYEILTNSDTSEEISPEIQIENIQFACHFESAEYLYQTLSPLRGVSDELFFDNGFWAWLTLFYFSQIGSQIYIDGKKKVLDNAKYIPKFDAGLTYYRHLLSGPYNIYAQNSDATENIRVVLFNKIHLFGDIIEAVSGRMEFTGNKELLELITRLYWDETGKKPKVGAATDVRRLCKYFKQISLVWDLGEIKFDKLYSILPYNFSKFKQEH
jgi:hypothetical protein